MRRFIIITVLSAIVIFQSISGQTTDYSFFDQGVKFYRQKNFTAARANFLKITSEFPDSRIMTASLLMLMRSQYKLKDYEMAEATGNLLIKKYPYSSYKDDAYYWLGCIKFSLQQNQHAVLYWLLSYKYADDERLKNQLSEYLRKAMTNLLTEPELDRLANNLDDPDLKIIAQISYAKILISRHKYRKASTILKNLLQLYPGHKYIGLAQNIYKDIPLDMISSKKLLISLPISGEYGDLGKAIMEGFNYARREIDGGQSLKADPIVFIDDSNSTVVALKYAKQAIENEDIWGMVGSLTNDVSASLAALSYYNQIPIISPTASDKAIHAISPQFFQINPDPYRKGMALARFAKEKLPHKNIAVIAPNDQYGSEFVNGFRSVWADTDSVRYISTQFFDPGTNSFLNHLKTIRREALHTMFADSVYTENPELTREEFLSMYQVWMDEQMKALEELYGKKVDTLTIPVENIDIFIAAIYQDQVEPFARQYKYFNFKSRLLGNEGWYVPESLQKIKNYTSNGLIFLTPVFIDKENNTVINFRNAFRMTMQTTPEKMHILGYNLGKWLYPAFRDSDSKKEFIKSLENNPLRGGIGQEIRFQNGNRVNTYLNLIEYKFGHFMKIN